MKEGSRASGWKSQRLRLPLLDRDRSSRYFANMSTKELAAEAIALPLLERVSLAQVLWQSIHSNLADTSEDDAVRESIRRDGELSAGTLIGRTHEEVFQAARQSIGCA